MNKRKAKKQYYKQFLLCSTYKAHKHHCRHSHMASIDLARKEHRNYWEGWNKGYPNRMRIRQILG